MQVKRLLRPTNRRARVLVGLLLAGLFCIQFAGRTEADRSGLLIEVVDGKVVGANSTEVRARVEELARTDHVALLRYCLANYEGRYQDYTCKFIKQERIRGKLGKAQEIAVKFTDSPFRVAMAWTKNAPIGDRLIYVQGRYDDMMLVRPHSKMLRWLGTQKRRPDGPDAMKNTLRPVTGFGFANATRSLIGVYAEARRAGESKEEFGGYAKVDGRECIVLIRRLPATSKTYPAWRTTVYIDLEYLLPVCLEGLNWDKKLACRYSYTDVKFNVGLDGGDFLPQTNDMVPPK